MEIKDKKLIAYEIDAEYLKFLGRVDTHVPIKNHRRFVGIVVSDDGVDYCIPLTSADKKGIKSRQKNMFTTKIHSGDDNELIAMLLYNDMIPVPQSVLRIVDLSKDADRDYLKKELQYLNRQRAEVLLKAQYMLDNYNKTKNRRFCVNLTTVKQQMFWWVKGHPQEKEMNTIADNISRIGSPNEERGIKERIARAKIILAEKKDNTNCMKSSKTRENERE